MRAVVQRVSSASVTVRTEGLVRESGRIEAGFLVLLGVGKTDSEQDAKWLAEKITNLRVFEDEDGKLNLSLQDVSGSVLVVSNFTLYGDCRKGRRPSFTDAASGVDGVILYNLFLNELTTQGIPVAAGVYGDDMQVSLVNDGPITLLLDSKKLF